MGPLASAVLVSIQVNLAERTSYDGAASRGTSCVDERMTNHQTNWNFVMATEVDSPDSEPEVDFSEGLL